MDLKGDLSKKPRHLIQVVGRRTGISSDGLMKGISENFKKPISIVRFTIETTVVILGWLLGGTVGIGTVLFAILIGPLISITLYSIKNFYKIKWQFFLNNE